MPVKDGYQATDEIRALERELGRDRTPVVALTANAMQGDRERCLDAGMDDYLAKPFSQDNLLVMLNRWLGDGDGGEPEPVAEAPAVVAGPPAEADPLLDEAVIESLRQLGARAGNDLLGRVLEKYLQETPKIVQNILRAMTEQDWESLRKEAHLLKSSSGNVGARGLSALARDLEHAAKDGDRAVLERGTGVISQLYERTRSALNQLTE
jgi:two-component system sensor histidine kinase/response regulator